ncbi:HGGxSTG domain-containing protein [Phenylobacterium montanum]|uniref:Uncharacterized protein n=1 Tax=Phenylobacterium montanum TaxID=2823693 RepID=A0A975ITK4_9CAUL|nr:HGGxSTG domain-containing protein [Caulobacter sp. S6]QUD86957.1 hypothetical protein KCG34_18040 [Caulobacter sp. S6]
MNREPVLYARELIDRALAWPPEELAAAKRRWFQWHRRRSIVWEAYRRTCEEVERANADLRRSFMVRARSPSIPYPKRPPELEQFPPAELSCLPCGARTRAGTRCRLTTIYENGRCKFHGGASTGQRTDAGRERAIANLQLRWKARCEADPKPKRPSRAKRIEMLEAKLRAQLDAIEARSEPHEGARKVDLSTVAAIASPKAAVKGNHQ